MKKKLLIAATVATIGIGGLSVGAASAATNTSGASGTSIVDKLVAKFGLNKSDVQAVFDENRTAREAERLSKLQERLDTAVKDGKLTQKQSDAIVAKFKELQSAREANREKFESMTDEERKSAMEAERTAFEKWKTDNNIPDAFARLVHMGRMGGMGMHGNAPVQNDDN